MIVAIIQARMGATRLPGKVLKGISGHPVLFHVVERVRRAANLTKVVVATTMTPEDDEVAAFCTLSGYDVFRGSSSDVLARYYEAAKGAGADTVVRITCDCPLIDPVIIDRCVGEFNKLRPDYLSNVVPGERTFPRGLDTEVFSFPALERAHLESKESFEREHVTPYIWQNKNGSFVISPTVKADPEYNRPQYRLTLDFPEDLELFQKIYGQHYKRGKIIPTLDVIRYLDENPDVVAINAFRDKEQVKV
jgi:spore coat polysaccharide biosynthesis protein SpsF